MKGNGTNILENVLGDPKNGNKANRLFPELKGSLSVAPFLTFGLESEPKLH